MPNSLASGIHMLDKKIASFVNLLQRIEKRILKSESASSLLAIWRSVTFFFAFLLMMVFCILPSLRLFLYGPVFILLGIFAFLVYYHNLLKKRIYRYRLWYKIKETNLARIRLEWDKIPEKVYPVSAEHPYALDLAITGNHSLMQLLDTTISTRGTKFLMDWLLYPEHDMKKLQSRQHLVCELKGRSVFRDKLTLESLCVSENAIDGKKILTCLRMPLPHWIHWISKLEIILWTGTVMFFLSWLLFPLPPIIWSITYLVYMLIFFICLPYMSPLFYHAIALEIEFRKLEAVFLHLEKNRSDTPEMTRSFAPFRNLKERPSYYLKKISQVCAALSVQGNSLVHIIVNSFCPWDFFFVSRWEKVRSQLVAKIPLWLDTLGEIEAASALANFADNNPNFTLPLIKITQKRSDASIHAEDIGHPFIPIQKRKTNSFTMNGIGRLSIITGSNMSGKSTFIKAIGINICLAQAGSFVCASSFSISFFRIYGCIHINESIPEGLSSFYAEVKRLKAILDASRDWDAPPLFVLIDEIFRGTNNKERIIGSSNFLLAMIKNNFLGMVSTHDLEVTKISNREKERIVNYHFQEIIENRQMKFDYLLRPGPCPTTNALRILKLEGLPVSDEILSE